MSRILIEGGTGLVGNHLTEKLLDKGHQLALLSRKKRNIKHVKNFQWDIYKNEIDPNAFDGIDHIINLAGAGIADKRWSPKYKQVILDSRIKSANILWDQVNQQKINLKSYVAASAIGYYGNRNEEWLTEEVPPIGNGFMIDCCQQWEEASQQFETTANRLVILRIGIVLSKKGGALSKMLPSYKANIGSYFGDGQQYYSWIHIDDLVDLIINSIENNEMKGIYNAVSPNPVSNKLFSNSIGKALNKSALIMPVPAIALRLAMGEMADVVLNGNRVSADKILETGFKFKFPELIPALKDVVERKV